jgi:hypothetical protein
MSPVVGPNSAMVFCAVVLGVGGLALMSLGGIFTAGAATPLQGCQGSGDGGWAV